MEEDDLQDIRTQSERDLLVLENITANPVDRETGLGNFSLTVQEGEILGIGSAVGNGERTLARVLAGISYVKKGRILFQDEEITDVPVNLRMQQGFRWLPANPVEEMLLPSHLLRENGLSGSRRRSSNPFWGWLFKGRIRRWIRNRLNGDGALHPDLQKPLSTLSRDKQQKVALARVLSGSPRFVVLEQPGHGMDLEAQERLHKHVRLLNACGVTFLVLSYNLDDLLLLADRVGVLHRGRLMGIVTKQEARREELERWMLGVADEQDAGC